jgi:hypothetical protein
MVRVSTDTVDTTASDNDALHRSLTKGVPCAAVTHASQRSGDIEVVDSHDEFNTFYRDVVQISG